MPIYDFPKGNTKAEMQKALLKAANVKNKDTQYMVVLADNGTNDPTKLAEKVNAKYFGDVTITRVSTGLLNIATTVSTVGDYTFTSKVFLREFDTNMVSFNLYKTSATSYRLEIRKTADGTLVDLWGAIEVELVIVEDLEGI